MHDKNSGTGLAASPRRENGMQTRPAETATDHPPASGGFRHERHSLSYGDMAGIRAEAARFLRRKNLSDETVGNTLLILTEILNNLVKHPPRPAARIDIRVDISDGSLVICVRDDSTPFAHFDAKCESARRRLHTVDTGAEEGYGLGCILNVSKSVSYSPMQNSADGLNAFTVTCALAAPVRLPKVFLIDDDPISLDIHRRMLADSCGVITFERAEEALAAVPHEKPDLIISDLVMPGMDGIALRQALDRMDGGGTTPFIFLSGKSSNEHNPYISQLGVDDFLCKPVSAERLRTVVTRLLRRSEQVRHSVQSAFHHDITALLAPSLPAAYGGWRFQTLHRTAEAGGGDFILHRENPSHLMAVLTDVMGHGRQAKFFSYVYAGYLHSLFRMQGGAEDPALFLHDLSRAVGDDPLLETTVMTCQCFQFYPDGSVRIASAGHPCPLLLRGQTAEIIPAAGPLPGLVGDSVYEIKNVRVQPGDKILFMTDGFLDSLNRRGRAAETLVQKLSTATPQALWQRFLAGGIADRPDDATLIIAEYGGSP